MPKSQEQAFAESYADAIVTVQEKLAPFTGFTGRVVGWEHNKLWTVPEAVLLEVRKFDGLPMYFYWNAVWTSKKSPKDVTGFDFTNYQVISVITVPSLDLVKSDFEISQVPQVDLSRFPKKCPRCCQPAYEGFSGWDCSSPLCGFHRKS